MKRLFFILMSVCLAMVSCDKGQVLNDQEQKVKLEQVADDFMNLFPSNEYKNLLKESEDLISHCERYFSDEDYDWSELEDALGEIGESLFDEKQLAQNKWEYTYTIFLSNCTGIVTLGKNKAEYQEADVSKLIIKDVDGKDWEAEVTPKGLKEVYLGEFMEEYYGYDDIYIDIYDITVEIPSSLAFSLKKGGTSLTDIEIRLDYDFGDEGIDLENTRIGIEVDFRIDDLTYTLKRASVSTSEGKVELSHSLKKGSTLVFANDLTVLADLDIEEDGGDIYIEDWDGSVDVFVDILGQMQVRGKCDDVRELAECMSDDMETQEDCERIARKATKLININVYYDGTSIKQAWVEFEPVVEDYYGESYYWVEPVLVFNNGTRYLFYEYFDDEIFEDIIEDFIDLLYDYGSMVESIY